MSVIARLEFHAEGPPLHVHFTRLGQAISDDDPRRFAQVLRELESALTQYAEVVAGVRTRLENRLDTAVVTDG